MAQDVQEASRRVMVHACCAPCAAAAIPRLCDDGYEPTLFFSNSNIAPEREYGRRLEAVRMLTEAMGVGCIEDDYSHERWRRYVAGLETEPERGLRCAPCFEYNLRRTASRARALGYGAFTTTLTTSPHKDPSLVFAVGRAAAGAGGGPAFLPMDFKKRDGFRRSVEVSRRLGLYRQAYCGCEFSRRETPSGAAPGRS